MTTQELKRAKLREDIVLIRPFEGYGEFGSLALPGYYDDRQPIGQVINIPKGASLGFGIGDWVVFIRWAAKHINVEDEELCLARLSDVVAVIETQKE